MFASSMANINSENPKWHFNINLYSLQSILPIR